MKHRTLIQTASRVVRVLPIAVLLAVLASEGALNAESDAPDSFKTFTSREFGFSANMPEDVLEVRTKHSFGLVANFKGLSESRMATIGVTVNQIDKFVAASERGDAGFESSAIEVFFQEYTSSLVGIRKSGFRKEKIQWMGLTGFKYSFPAVGVVADGVESYHSGFFFLHRGRFYNLTVTSLIGPRESMDELVSLRTGFYLLISD